MGKQQMQFSLGVGLGVLLNLVTGLTVPYTSNNFQVVARITVPCTGITMPIYRESIVFHLILLFTCLLSLAQLICHHDRSDTFRQDHDTWRRHCQDWENQLAIGGYHGYSPLMDEASMIPESSRSPSFATNRTEKFMPREKVINIPWLKDEPAFS